MATKFFSCASLNLQPTFRGLNGNKKSLQKVKELVSSVGIPSLMTTPHESLQRGNWFKLICGASFEDVIDIRNLSLVYTLAGVDCIDCAADGAVVNAVVEGIEAARDIVSIRKPWVMISVNDDEDLHFRKAEFDPDECPVNCSRPCEIVCPANAISLQTSPTVFKGGVITERCYGCGRCLPVCPYDKIRAITYVRDASVTAELLRREDVDALEIHTNGRQSSSFKELWNGLGNAMDTLKLIAVSMPDTSNLVLMKDIYSIMEPGLLSPNLWQLDGRPMSGDIGRGATRETIAFAVRMAAEKDKPPGFLQLAGGTNGHTINILKHKRLFQVLNSQPGSSMTNQAIIGGVAFGGYARKIVGRVLSLMRSQTSLACRVEEFPDHLLMALVEAIALVGTIKLYNRTKYAHLLSS